MLKKILVVVGALFGLLIVAAITVPLFVDVDKYRPQILQAANQQINGKLDLGKLSLSLWGQIKIQIQGLDLKDAQGRNVVAVKDAYFHLPFTSVLSGSPELVLNLQKPVLNVVKDKNGKLNVMTLVKSSGEKGKEPQAPQATPPSKSGGEMKLPGLAARARLGIELKDALVTYQDLTTGLSTQVKDLNVNMRDLSLSHESTIEISAEFDTQMKGSQGSKGMVLKGPADIKMKAKPTIANGQFQRLDTTGNADFDALEIEMPGTFHKKKGQDAHVDWSLSASPSDAKIEKFLLKFFNADINANGTVSNLGSGASPVVDLTVKSNQIDLKPWVELLPSLKDYELSGTASMDAHATGPSDKLNIKGQLKVDGLTAKAPMLKAQSRFDLLINAMNDQADLNATMKAPGNDLKIVGKLVSFSKPNVNIQVTSTGMDLDQLVDFPKKQEQAKAQAPKEEKGQPTAKFPGKTEDYDAMLDPLRNNKMMKDAVVNASLSIPKLKAYGILVTDITAKKSVKDLVASLDSFGMKVFGGTISANARTDLKPKAPTYKFSTKVNGLDLQQAIDSQLHLFKNTVVGKAQFEASGDGASFNSDRAIPALHAKGKMRVNNAAFTTIDVGKMVTQALGAALSKIGDKIPGMKGKQIGAPSGASKYEYITSDFSVSGGKFSAPNFMTKAEPNKGIDLKGNTVVSLKDYSLDAKWMVIDTYDMTGAKKIASPIGGGSLLAAGNQPVQFPINVGCTLMNPCYNYGAVPEFLLNVAMKNAAGGAKAEAQKRAGDLLKNKLKGLGGGIFGH